MMTPADILDAAALLALRCEPGAGDKVGPQHAELREVNDSLAMLIERWKWDFACDAADTTRHDRILSSRKPVTDKALSAQSASTQDVHSRVEVITEVLATELLLRVYTVLLIAHGHTALDSAAKSLVDDSAQAINDMGRYARQHCMLSQAHLSSSFKLYRLQKRLDRWSDILLAPILNRCRLDRFWISRLQAEEWSSHPWNQIADRDVAALLLRKAIQAAIPGDAAIPQPRRLLIERLISATLMLIRDAEFTSDGCLMSRLQVRASEVSTDTRPPWTRHG